MKIFQPFLAPSIMHHYSQTQRLLDFTVEPARNGLPTLTYQGKYLHSRYKPDEEATQWAESLFQKEPGILSGKRPPILILLGMGLGYPVDAILNLFQSQITLKPTLFVMDPYLELVHWIKTHRNPNWLDSVVFASMENLTMIQDVMDLLVEEDEAGLVKVVTYHTLESVFSESFHRAQTFIHQHLKNKLQNHLTTLGFGNRWSKNILKNVSQGDRVSLFAKATCEMKNPVIVLGSGPSLEQEIETIKTHQDQWIIIAAVSTIPILVKHGIRPDWIVSADAGYPNRWHIRHLELLEDPSVLILTCLSNLPLIFEYPQPVFLFSSDLPLEQQLFRGIDIYTIPIQGTVTMVSLQFALNCFSGPVALIGMDFGFTRGYYHYRGNAFEEQLHWTSLRYDSQLNQYLRFLKSFSLTKVPAFPEGFLQTNAAMASYGNVLVQFAQRYRERVVNGSSGGMLLQGINHTRLHESGLFMQGERLSKKPGTAEMVAAVPLDQHVLKENIRHLQEILEHMGQWTSYEFMMNSDNWHEKVDNSTKIWLKMMTAKTLEMGKKQGWSLGLDDSIRCVIRQALFLLEKAQK